MLFDCSQIGVLREVERAQCNGVVCLKTLQIDEIFNTLYRVDILLLLLRVDIYGTNSICLALGEDLVAIDVELLIAIAHKLHILQLFAVVGRCGCRCGRRALWNGDCASVGEGYDDLCLIFNDAYDYAILTLFSLFATASVYGYRVAIGEGYRVADNLLALQYGSYRGDVISTLQHPDKGAQSLDILLGFAVLLFELLDALLHIVESIHHGTIVVGGRGARSKA